MEETAIIIVLSLLAGAFLGAALGVVIGFLAATKEDASSLLIRESGRAGRWVWKGKT